MKPTQKLYYSNPNMLTAESAWVAGAQPNTIILMASPAYPEGGGQLGDSGVIEQGNVSISFHDTKKCGVGRPIVRHDFPTITVDHQVQLTLSGLVPEGFDPAKPVLVRVNEQRRHQLSRSHTAAHLVWLALTERFGNLYPVVRGCHIVETQGRFDLLIDRPSEQDLRDAEGLVYQWVYAQHEIEIVTMPGEPECRIWRSAGRDVPCGGTHLANTRGVGSVRLRVKSKGKSGFRVIYEITEAASYGESPHSACDL